MIEANTTTERVNTIPAVVRSQVQFLRIRYSHTLHGGKPAVYGACAIRDLFEKAVCIKLKESYPSTDFTFFCSTQSDKVYLDLQIKGIYPAGFQTEIATDITILFHNTANSLT